MTNVWNGGKIMATNHKSEGQVQIGRFDRIINISENEADQCANVLASSKDILKGHRNGLQSHVIRQAWHHLQKTVVTKGAPGGRGSEKKCLCPRLYA